MPTLRKKCNQPSWRLATDDVKLWITEQAGHMGPVVFDRQGRKIQPFGVAPWADEKVDKSLPQILKVLRGDFFCMPFGGNDEPYDHEQHPIHGDTANKKWKLISLKETKTESTIHLSQKQKNRQGRVDKYIQLLPGHQAIYCRHVISQMTGPMNFGHHAILKFPDYLHSGKITTSGFAHGQTYTHPTEKPEEGGYSILKPNATFRSLSRVPLATGGYTDLSKYPDRRGYEDIIQLINKPGIDFGWTAATFPKEHYVWFALKDPRILTGTIFWISNGGRHMAPWNGRHINTIGLEEVTSYFHEGLASSARKNSFTEKGFTTALQLSPQKPLTINYIMGVVKIPRSFDEVANIKMCGNHISLISKTKKTVQTPINLPFLYEQCNAAECV